jgi:UDP:flavonoid glycosyltransferase YjiC (YdhE family)
MAHFVRPLVLADSLDPALFEIHFYAPSRFLGYLAGRPWHTGPLDCMPSEQFLHNLAHARPMFPADVIQRYVLEDQAIIRKMNPHLVIGDMRPSLAISAALAHVPSVNLTSGYWSPFATFKPTIIPELGKITRILPPRYFGGLYRVLEPGAIKNLVKPTNQIREKYGLPPLPPDLGMLYTAGDYALYADIPEFVPTANLPPEHCFVGICPWNPPTQKPEWWDRMTSDPKPKVFVALGSSGPLRALPNLLNALGKLPVSVILATSGRPMPASASAAYTTDLLPLAETAEFSALVVSHGGSPSVYPALAAGTPILGIPSNGDQHLCTALMESHGAGLGVRVEEASEARLAAALGRLLNEKSFRDKAQEWKKVFARYDSGTLFNLFMARLFP